ncbi:hypothetical protein LMIY3S_05078 [Labrys miyagiensis]
MLTRIVAMALVSAFAFTAPAIAGEPNKTFSLPNEPKETLSFVQPKTMNPDWLTDGFWLDNSAGIDCDTYASEYNKTFGDNIEITEKLKTMRQAYYVGVSGKGTQYKEYPEQESGECTLLSKPSTISGNQRGAIMKCSGEGEEWLLASTLIRISPKQVVLINTPTNADKSGLSLASTQAKVLNYCGKINLTLKH